MVFKPRNGLAHNTSSIYLLPTRRIPRITYEILLLILSFQRKFLYWAEKFFLPTCETIKQPTTRIEAST